eukprot:TRINITY_DN6497_c0_g1_i1.p2 TRINITY_DN6497_c0_g1~~TRINITY_DN6497_c0_g1_i1.p2  ORF type:complete len:110 (-),score=28.02 TRINITY_DN6497_c0_g1_i1:194-523(-)
MDDGSGKMSLVEWDQQEARWQVLMDDGSGKMLKSANLEPCTSSATGAEARKTPLTEPCIPAASSTAAGLEPGVRVRVKGLQARPELNGAFGSVVEWDQQEARWTRDTHG